MLALYGSSPLAIGMALEEYDQNYMCGPTNNFADSSSFAQDPDIPSLQQQQDVAELDQSLPSTTITGDLTMIKKLSHNASERDRRKKINSLYSSLRSLLPVSDQTVNLISMLISFTLVLQKKTRTSIVC